MALDRHFAGVGRQAGDRAGKPGFGGDIGEQIVDSGRADDAEHGGAVGGGQGKVAHAKSSPYGVRSVRDR